MKKFVYLFTLSFLIFLLMGCGGNAENFKKSDPAPNFTLQDANGNSYTLSDYNGKSVVVLYFYPKASTPGCTTQACGIRDEYQRFSDNGIVVFGISVDSKEAIKEFIDEYSLNFPLLSDENKTVAKDYGVLNDLGIASRITFIVDKDGSITKIIRDVDVDTHADDVFAIASKL